MMPRHPFDPFSLIFGLLFGTVAVLAAIGPADRTVDVRWVIPTVLMLAGLALLAPRRHRGPIDGSTGIDERASHSSEPTDRDPFDL